MEFLPENGSLITIIRIPYPQSYNPDILPLSVNYINSFVFQLVNIMTSVTDDIEILKIKIAEVENDLTRYENLFLDGKISELNLLSKRDQLSKLLSKLQDEKLLLLGQRGQGKCSRRYF